MGGVRDILTSSADNSNDPSDDEPSSKRLKVSWLSYSVVHADNVYNVIESSIVVWEGIWIIVRVFSWNGSRQENGLYHLIPVTREWYNVVHVYYVNCQLQYNNQFSLLFLF